MYFIILLLIFYLLHVQLSPGMGNIWYRNNEYFSPMGAIKMILAPLHLYYMWYPSMWDINFFMWMLLYLIVYKLCYTFNIFNKDNIKN